MSGLDALLWRIQDDPVLRSPITLVGILESAPDWDAFLAEHERYLRLVPRFGQRVLDGPLGLGFPRWAPEPRVDLGYHVRRVRLPAPGGLGALMAFARTTAQSPFGLHRPLWEAVPVEDVGGIAELLFEPDPDARRRVDERVAALAREARAPRCAGGRVLGPVADAVEAGARLLGVAAHPVRAARGAGAVVRSPTSVVSRVDVPASPLFRARGGPWRFLPLDSLRGAAHEVGGTVNDALVAAVLGAVRRYHEHFGVEPGTMPVAIALGRQGAQPARSGNDFSFARVSAPVAEVDPVRRMRAVDVHISNVRGPARPLSPAGRRLLACYPFGPLPATAVCVSMGSYAGTCCIGVNVDTAAVTDPDLFARCLSEGFDEVLAEPVPWQGSPGEPRRGRPDR
ncbi:wax ester/triacylglycerol synthase domain-containing protein [Saccharothrix xinjiangensis]|uniref:diacylglycerol O-acyltransferase n=1 Tax=Saccharothrix xinjiangensis TaxID=204798 RepID=A0ABV9XUZ0_9PSEU